MSTVTPTFPNTVIEMPNFATDSAAAVGAVAGDERPRPGSGPRSPARPTPRPASGPRTSTWPRSTTSPSALELDWYEDIGLCGEGEAEKLLRDGVTALGGRVPVNPSGGLSCFGEAIPAQAIAQVCECVWQLRGNATRPPGRGGQGGGHGQPGPFGHGSSVLLSR